jgi:hypothetical protein
MENERPKRARKQTLGSNVTNFGPNITDPKLDSSISEDPDQEEREVEKIMDIDIPEIGEVKYQVQWKGYEPEWTLYSKLGKWKDLIDAYHVLKNTTHPRKRKLTKQQRRYRQAQRKADKTSIETPSEP